ncbi:MAG TPA: tyrosine-type recombinase/integrase [Acidimicrobiales bacterium]|nr:tyrosine-type recombinase/integrase [Acidimicrobiales bacterium]
MTTGRRHFGSVRRRSSGRWQATYRHEGQLYSLGSFPSKADALAYLSTVEADIRRGAWIDPRAGQETLRAYAEEWLNRRPDIAERTRELYRYVLDEHILPSLGHATLIGLAPSKIRGWHAGIAQDHPATAAKAYRLLSSIMRTAVVDGLILTSPCKVDGAGSEHAAERPVATVAEVEKLTKAMPEHLRLIVPLAAWCQLRRGEILGLRRKDVDVMHAIIRIEQSRTFAMDGTSIIKQPKTAAGRRTIAVPKQLMAAIIEHLERFTDVGPESLVLHGRLGAPLTRDALQGSWERSRLTIGRPDLRLHDLRHTGLTLAAATGATTAELMHRAGHSSTPAALRYQHATRDRDRVLSDALEKLIEPAIVIPFYRDSESLD